MALLSDPIELEVDRATHALRLQNLPSGSLYRPDRKNSFGEYDVALFEYNYSLEQYLTAPGGHRTERKKEVKYRLFQAQIGSLIITYH